MKFVVCWLLASAVAATDDASSLLQTKKAKDSSLDAMISSARRELNIKDKGELDKVDQFVSGLLSMTRPAESQDEALLRRASQNAAIKTRVGEFEAMSTGTQAALVQAGSSIYKAMPETQQIALIGHLEDSGALESAVAAKTRTFTNFEHGVETKVTETRNGKYYHKHAHSSRGTTTETSVAGKYSHKHDYRHNGRGGNARTNTASSTGDWSHAHSHSHVNGVTNTATATVTRGEHSHSHTHSHNPGVGTATNTETWSDGVGSHQHNHHHSER